MDWGGWGILAWVEKGFAQIEQRMDPPAERLEKAFARIERGMDQAATRMEDRVEKLYFRIQQAF